LDKSVEFQLFGKSENLEKRKNAFGYKTSASVLRYHVRLVDRAWLLGISTHKETAFDRNKKQRHDKPEQSKP
jgi:hypothetical protein